MSKIHPLVRNFPIWKFYYQGNHSHPIRRTVAVIENNRDSIIGYEMRQGNVSHTNLQDAPIKTFKKTKIAKVRQLDARRPLRRDTYFEDQSTLTKQSLREYIVEGA